MLSPADRRAEAEGPQLSPVARAERLRGVSLWLAQLDRAVRNCLLYGRQNPAMVRIRAQLAESLIQLVRRFDPLVIRFTADAAHLEQEPVLIEQSVRDSLVALLHRDGIRGLTVRLGVQAAEVDALLEAVVRSSGPNNGESDLVTALWEADFQHVEVDAAPLEADFVPDLEGEEKDSDSFLPWPLGTGTSAGDGDLLSGDGGGGADGAESAGARSDDWPTAATLGLGLAATVEPSASPPPEVECLRAAYEKEQARSLLDTAMETARACLATIPHGEKIPELRQFLQRVMRQAVQGGDWSTAGRALDLAVPPDSPPSERGESGRQLLGAVSIAETIRTLDRQPAEGLNGYLAWAQALGDAAPEWILHAMAESQERRHRRLLAQALAEACRRDPGVLSPWMGDERWYVVRNLVFVLGLIGGDAIGPLVQQVTSHPERRVRRQCLVALGTMSPPGARPVLLSLLRDPDPDLFRGALSLLVAHPDPVTARGILESLIAADAAHRPEAERTALAAAVGTAGGNEILPILERLFAGDHWICRQPSTCRALVASVVRIGTPEARAFVEHGVRSKNGVLRAACAAALGSIEHDG